MAPKSTGSAIYDLLRRRLNRRDLIVGGGMIAVGGAVGCSRPAAEAATKTSDSSGSGGFAAIAGSTEDRIIVPEGYTAQVRLRWGDPVVAGAAGLAMDEIPSGRMLEPGAAALQAEAFGASCDGMGIIPIDETRIAICVNHETPEMGRMFPGWNEALRSRRAAQFLQENPSAVAVMRASVGFSVLEFERTAEGWRFVPDSAINRRVTADTPIEFSGPAASHAWLDGSAGRPGRCIGTLGNCAAGATPWGTYVTAEENTNDFFGNGAQADFEPMLARANVRIGMRRGASIYRWEAVDERFDHAKHPAESMKFGWIVEIDPLDPGRPIKKRTALGKLRHEGATAVLNSAGRPVVYMGDDSPFEYFYKFVSDRIYDPNDRAGTDALLDEGTLYVARLDEDGSGEWLPLVHGAHEALSASNGFLSQADVVLRCREAADLLGATALDRPEDVAVHPHDGRIYVSCTQGLQRGFEPPRPGADPSGAIGAAEDPNVPGAGQAPVFPVADAANPRSPNPYGHILEFTEAGNDAAATRFAWDVFILAGDPVSQGLTSEMTPGRLTPSVAYYAGRSDSAGLSGFACPDNLGFDEAGNLWIVTDGPQPTENNNGCFMCPTSGAERGKVMQFMSGPIGAEISGCTFSPDGQTLFLTVQHPGGSSSIEAPSSHWPDGGSSQPRSSLIAVTPIDSSKGFPS